MKIDLKIKNGEVDKFELEMNGADVAKYFWSLDSKEQILFFNELGLIADHYDICVQLSFILSEMDSLTEEGRVVIALLVSYLKEVKQ